MAWWSHTRQTGLSHTPSIQNSTLLDAQISYDLPDNMTEVACISKECSGMYARSAGQQSLLKTFLFIKVLKAYKKIKGI